MSRKIIKKNYYDAQKIRKENRFEVKIRFNQ